MSTLVITDTTAKPKRLIKIYGDVILPENANLPLAKESCLNVFVQEEIYCIYCEIPIFGEHKIFEPQVNDNRISYSLEVDIGSAAMNSYTLQATLNNGWCGSEEEWIRYNDFRNDFSHVVQVGPDTVSVRKDIKMKQYIKRLSRTHYY